MGAIPSSEMPGHKRLHARVLSALDRCQEGQAIDFKESAPWESLKWRIAVTALGMAFFSMTGLNCHHLPNESSRVSRVKQRRSKPR